VAWTLPSGLIDVSVSSVLWGAVAILGAPIEPLIAVVLLVLAAVILMARGVADNIGAGLAPGTSSGQGGRPGGP
jgi:hypothetical protein